MYRVVIPLFALAILIAGCPKGGGDDAPSMGSGTKPASSDSSQAATTPPKTTPAIMSPIARGDQIYHDLDYSNTSLTCADCHADSPAAEENRIFIAHSGHGAYKRGAWKITSQEQLDAGKGYSDTVLEAANVCVKAAYMDNPGNLIEGDDAEALVAYLESIATDDEPFIIARAKEMPAAGLTPDKAHGKEIFEMSCAHCHGVKDGIEDLTGASEWLNALQVMAKVRKIGSADGWYNDWDGKEYAVAHTNYLALLGIGTAYAQENPCGENPCAEDDEDEGHEGHDHDDDDDHGMFKEGAMPFFGTDILSDQDVVDVAFYVAEDL